ncbi:MULTISPECIES: hypothetical protein [Bradyrhizobium]|uniref:hypothetical protein n=1 Tax=Bradyrhizobium elkanii TaxID=29448 RepID=UPI001FD9CFF0|nr:hypothetical protein [Bradyrhizobium elkanii]
MAVLEAEHFFDTALAIQEINEAGGIHPRSRDRSRRLRSRLEPRNLSQDGRPTAGGRSAVRMAQP